MQPEFFVEMSEQLAKEKGIKNGSWVRVWSKRGSVKGKAVVTKRMKPFMIDGKTVHQVGMPLNFGFIGETKKASPINSLTPRSATPTRRRRSSRRSWSISSPSRARWHKGRHHMFTPIANPTTKPVPAKFGEQDLIRRSASTCHAACQAADRSGQADRRIEVHRLQGLPGGVP